VSQGKYAREILGKFHMEGCKPMDTPLLGNWRKEDATFGEIVDATFYRQFDPRIGSRSLTGLKKAQK
jgi:hypothetical protein